MSNEMGMLIESNSMIDGFGQDSQAHAESQDDHLSSRLGQAMRSKVNSHYSVFQPQTTKGNTQAVTSRLNQKMASLMVPGLEATGKSTSLQKIRTVHQNINKGKRNTSMGMSQQYQSGFDVLGVLGSHVKQKQSVKEIKLPLIRDASVDTLSSANRMD